MQFRMTRWEYMQTLVGLGPKRTPRTKHRSGQKPKKWVWSLDGKGGTVTAHTRSHARSEIKSALGIKNGRVPFGLELNCI
jgi:hypothetical protein